MTESALIIDSHVHLWDKLKGIAGGCAVKSLGGGKSTFAGGIRQMMPPYMADGRNTVGMLIANMDYSGVAAAAVTQEYIDGSQNDYLLGVRKAYPDRFKVFGLADFSKPGFYRHSEQIIAAGFDGIKVPAKRLAGLPDRVYLNSVEMMKVFRLMEQKGSILSIDLAEGNSQTGELEEVIQEYPGLKIAIGHFGMVTKPGWEYQIKLARYKNVMIESGGITWLFHHESYPYEGAVRAIREAAVMTGMGKLMWGSDYPRTMTAITYTMSYDFIMKAQDLSDEDKEMFLGLNAKKFYGFADLKIPVKVKGILED